jgi:hypothetical protein
MLKRWQVHVEEWLDAGAKHQGICLVRYEDLRDRYEETLSGIAERHSWARRHRPIPAKVDDKFRKSRADPSTDRYSEQDLQFFESEIGETMRRLQYERR